MTTFTFPDFAPPDEAWFRLIETGLGRFEIQFTPTGVSLLYLSQAHAIRYVSADRMDHVAVASLIAEALYSAETGLARKTGDDDWPHPYWGA
ncbi:hypothetical protein [Caulobacter soli]|uniref:hypothetical protein n=1 Tax=Caulobacter soli TaxID=2708539 RepID=UPI0013EA7C26|nr:hypothetical protein [Caulobacter soli]